MNLTDLIEKHVTDIRATVREASKKTRAEADLNRPGDLFDARLKRVDARIALLEKQNAETQKRFNQAIREQEKLRDEILKEAENWKARTPAQPPTRKKPPATKSGASGTGNKKRPSRTPAGKAGKTNQREK